MMFQSIARMLKNKGTLVMIRTQIYAAASETQRHVTELTAEETERIRSTIASLYLSNQTSHPIWERILEWQSIADPDGWRLIAEYVDDSVCVLFFDADEEMSMFRFGSGEDLQEVLGNCAGFVFYVTDYECSYLLCHNDHDYLIGCGKARSWLEKLSSRYE